MKVFLVLCLMAFITCKKSIIDIGMCMYKDPKVKDVVNTAVIAFVTKDYGKILPKIISSIPDIFKAALNCIVEEEEVTPKAVTYKCTRHELYECGINCKTLYKGIKEKYDECHELCVKNCGY